MTDTEQWPECTCEGPDCKRECEACAEFGSCVPYFLKRDDGPTEKDRRRERFVRHR